MQGRRSAVGSLPDTLGFDHGSTPSDATGLDQQICWNNMQNSSQNRLPDYSPNNTTITYLNSMTGEEQNLSGWNLVEPSSTDNNERKTEHGWSSSVNPCAEVAPILDERRFAAPNNFSLNNASVNLSSNQIVNEPLFPPSLISDSIPQDLNVSSGFVGPNTYKSSSSQNIWLPSSSSSSNPFGLPSGSNGYLVEENDARPGCKRKALEGNVGQSSASGSSSYYQRAEGSVWHGVQSRRNTSRGLCISSPSESSLTVPFGQLNQGLGLGIGGASSECPLPASGSGESSRRNLRMRINTPHQLESTPVHTFSTGTTVNNSLNLRSPPPADNTSPHENFLVAAHTPALRRNQQSARWNRNSISRPGSLNPGLSGERNAATPLEEPTGRTMPRNISEHPMFVPASGVRNSAQNPVNWSIHGGSNVSHGGNVSSTSRTGPVSGVHSSLAAAPSWVPPHRTPPHYPRRLVEIVRRSLLANGSESGGQSSNITPPGSGTPASSQETSLSSGEQGRHLSHSRSGVLLDRQLDGAFGIPYSMRSLASAGEGGRSRLMSEHIRNVLDIMRRGEGLRFEDVMILDQSVFFGMADIHDRHRDMRLDVDNMSYEELLALEERIGNVNTGLSEETILNCLKRRKCVTSTTTDQLDVEPCCVCQEEYKSGEDLGMLECGHDFHTDCIKQWLMQKNLCPICKTTALVT